ncbi:hypothetical protein [Synoicihabitans lomoniglobus]|uniref:Uncharacterized protein n=1 Tax=Synoicihabitans lomoniglobus TaxID=2909285 RepID=A0AAE9ZY12_9BACT|nr:hypothetical protein [Opitutaceae bacterium LMO-M01]WED65424.1 hypothetical protein PXH66_00995 [Opitutaceae bacterium LMO-M01]
MLSSLKDRVTSHAARHFANNLIRRYGVLESLRIDSRAQRIELVCLLHGEAQPLAVQVGNYRIESDTAESFITLRDCVCERPWIQALLIDFVHDTPLRLPRWVASAI